MAFFIIVLPILACLVLLTWWFTRGKDLRVYDHPVDPAACESFAGAQGPSAEHRRAEDEVRSAGGKVRGIARRHMLRFMRDYMEQIPAGRTFDCEFRPVDAGEVSGDWVLAPGADPARRWEHVARANGLTCAGLRPAAAIARFL